MHNGDSIPRAIRLNLLISQIEYIELTSSTSPVHNPNINKSQTDIQISIFIVSTLLEIENVPSGVQLRGSTWDFEVIE